MTIDTNETFGTKVGDGVIMAAGWVFVGAICVLLYQTYLWAKYGAWVHFSVLDGLKKVVGSLEGWSWLWFPSDWLGIHMVLERLPLWGGLMLLGVVLFFLGFGVAAMIDEMVQSLARRSPTNEDNQD